MTFVKTKLLIEKTPPGGRLEVHLKGAEPLENVPRSVVDHGHRILSLEALEGETGDPSRVHRLLIEKV